MTVSERPTGRAARQRRGNVLEEIAARRRADVRSEAASLRGSISAAISAIIATPRPRPIVERLAAPGLHLIAELKRRSPSAGAIAADGEDLVARARAYEAGGAAAISVLVEPHWFGGSIDDLRAVRAAVGIPVLAKEFVVDALQLPLLRAAGADVVLLLAALHRPRQLAKLVEQSLGMGLEPLVEAHDERELRAALATDARLIGLNNRDLRTLEVDTERAVRLRPLVPVFATPRRSPRGEPRASTPRSSGRRSSGRGTRRPPPARSSPPARTPRTSRTRPPSRSSRSAGSSTRRASPPRSAPGRTRSGSTSCRARPARCRRMRRSPSPASPVRWRRPGAGRGSCSSRSTEPPTT
jgi:indole-3-glycerol phosphate synthase